ncbi:MAG: hypothetical protein KC466_05480, partial [Myxococcales bacterium]|nr:hypothetical protein [Myxococcales bacterium]
MLRAYVEAASGAAADDFATFTIDTTPLPITITSPADGAIVDVDEATVVGTVGGEAVALRVNDVDVTPSGGTFTATVPLREGANALVAVAEKASGLTTTQMVEVTRDPFAPIVRIETPTPGFVAVSPAVTVTGYVNDIITGGVEPQVFVNGVAATVARGAFMAPDLPLKRGPNTITVWAVDAVGNEGTDEVGVTYQPPAGVRLRIVSGNAQSGGVSTHVADPLVVAVEDASGNPVAGRVVLFETSRGDGVLSTDGAAPFARVLRVATDETGQARARFRLGTSAGEGADRVRASAAGVAGSVEFCFAAAVGAPAKALMTMGDNQRGATGQPLPLPLEALIVDADGNPVPGVGVTFTVARGGGTIDGAGSALRTTRADGVA